MSWLNANSGAIIGVVGVFAFLLIFVLVGIICWYTYLLRQILKVTNRPEIAIYLRFTPTSKVDLKHIQRRSCV